ncbi:hypothetical protein Tsubulata_050501 [Turnera subulata]|uniref:DUF668 domain-containing protein n=1 Tax=Turnera subulata TaxID=218843 RepID=A0A9Q0GD12_9ROSI|nr:hypothetical protein Tsubulata_050501 [Turnera subulata]
MGESWFGNMRWKPRKGVAENEKEAIGVVAFEVVALMSRIISLWSYSSDGEICKLRVEILNSLGVKRLVSVDDDYIMELALNELLHNFGQIAKCVARLSRNCKDPVFRRFEHFVTDPVKYGIEWIGWEYRLKKMERKVNKMERYIAIMMRLSQELELLPELEQTVRRMKANPDLRRGKLLESKQRVMWQHQVIKNLQDMSPWVRTYDYTVRLLARSLLTTLGRIKHAFQYHQLASAERNNHHGKTVPDFLPRARSFSAHMHSSVHPSENILLMISSEPLRRSAPKSPASKKKSTSNNQQQLDHHSSSLHRRSTSQITSHLHPVGPLKGCLSSEVDSSILNSCRPAVSYSMRHLPPAKTVNKVTNTNTGSLSCSSKVYSKLAICNSKSGLLKAPPATLGDAALALHYANIILFIEKLVSSPHTVDSVTRDNLYNMLPSKIRSALRSRLKAYNKSLALFLYDASLAAEWSQAVVQILEWLSPLAHC